MCRNIRTLFNYEPPATDDEIRAASLQYVTKISGYPKPSVANEEAFEQAVGEVARASATLLRALVTSDGLGSPAGLRHADRDALKTGGSRSCSTALRRSIGEASADADEHRTHTHWP